MEGTVKFYNFKKRFGFIAGEDGKDYFVHQTGVEPRTILKEGTKVSFEIESDEKGPKATKVKEM
ncbi:MAG: cold-shock protein [Candidatus Diapherotrites archaeon CG08_land_8_20_14_0_20_30_16]|nr:MAG: cold-shock protein [Candidatus Diapherotrites archaeon CG08_land_8_20_14_0_20_30_16]